MLKVFQILSKAPETPHELLDPGAKNNSAIKIGVHSNIRLQLVDNAAAAFMALLITTVLDIYKPKGITPYGLRLQNSLR